MLLAVVVVVLSLAWGSGVVSAIEGNIGANKACSSDVQKFCKDVKPGGGRIVECLKSHQSELCDACSSKLTKGKSLKEENQKRVNSPLGIAVGIYQPQKHTYNGLAIDRYTKEVGKKPAFAWLPMTWQRLDGSYWQFDAQMLDEFRTRGIMPGLNWDPSKGSTESYTDRQKAINQPEFSWKQIISGRHDEYITQFAKDAAAYHYPFILRILHEMDGRWYPWGYSVNGNTNPADYVTAWTHIVDIFRKENATNVQFVWCPSVLNPDRIQKYGATLKQVYPGDNYVDWVALDGYSNPQNGWRSLQDEFKPSYDFITSFSARPMILFEVGSMEDPADPMARANWITQGFLTTIPSQLPKVKVAVWFNSKDGSGRDYRLQTSPNALAAWKQVVSNPLYQGTLVNRNSRRQERSLSTGAER